MPSLSLPAAFGIAEAAVPAVAEVALPAVAGAEVLGGAGEAALLADAGIAPLTAGVGAEAAGIGAGLGSGALDLGLGGGLADTLGGAVGTSAEALAPSASALTTAPVSTVSSVAAPAASTIGGPAAAAPIAPASVAEVSPAVSGDFGANGLAANQAEAVSNASLNASNNAFSLTDANGNPFAAGSGTTATSNAVGGSGLDKAISSATGGFLNSKDLGTALSLGGLGMNLLNRNQAMPGQKQISNAASGLQATAQGQAALGAQLESYLASGTLPPGLASGVRSATESAKAAIKSGYASRGESGSSAEAQDLQAAEDRALTASQQVALNLLQQGASLVGQSVNTESLSAQIYESILHDAMSRDKALGDSIGNFAAALAGGGAGGNSITLKTAA